MVRWGYNPAPPTATHRTEPRMTANDVKLELREHLRKTYLLAFDDFATTPAEVADVVEGVTNVRYSRELLGTLVNAGLLAVTDVNGDGDVWQVANPGTFDDYERDEAEEVIDSWLAAKIASPTTTKEGKTMTAKSTKPRTTKTKNPTGKCLCGCGENSTSNYRPGHDARHAGVVARQIAGPKVTPAQATKALATLPSEALRLKASAMADRIIDKAKAKQPVKSTEPTAAATKAANAKAPTPTVTKPRKAVAKKA